MRMFAAISLDEACRAAVAREQQRAKGLTGRASIRFVSPEQVHLTLAFMADVPAARVESLVTAMQAPLDGVPPFAIAFGGLGLFPAQGAPRVLWLGVRQGVREVFAAHRSVAARLASAGVAIEDRDFRPHLTIGRWRHSRPSDRPQLSGEAIREAACAMTVDCVTLYESRLSSEGPTHIERARALLT